MQYSTVCFVWVRVSAGFERVAEHEAGAQSAALRRERAALVPARTRTQRQRERRWSGRPGDAATRSGHERRRARVVHAASAPLSGRPARQSRQGSRAPHLRDARRSRTIRCARNAAHTPFILCLFSPPQFSFVILRVFLRTSSSPLSFSSAYTVHVHSSRVSSASAFRPLTQSDLHDPSCLVAYNVHTRNVTIT